VFYPLKALAADQYIGWCRTAEKLKLPEDFVGRIDGTVRVKERDAILKSARVLLMTPDVCHAWFMSNLANPTVKDFLNNLNLIILDEAHTLEGVFGSNFAFLFRRIQSARNNIHKAEKMSTPLSVIAATATISNPAEHMTRLTGLEFESVGESEDGSPQYQRHCIHIAAPENEEMTIAKGIQIKLLKGSKQGGFITFVDSRKGVEMLAVTSNQKLRKVLPGTEVLPYRAGIDVEDRKDIEKQLKKGTLRGVISTSALELGIDLPHLQVGINVGVPATRKSYRQRLGRVGRSGSGAFIVISDHNAFRRFGTSFREYHDMSVEPSYLYLDNRFMQYAHARCLVDELESIGAKDKASLPTRIGWPEGFDSVFKAARPGGNRPREFDAIAQMGSDMPQRNYPLRNVGEINFKISLGEQADQIGDANLAQALRECYPGATYYHMAKPYKVLSWTTNAFQPFIKVKMLKGAPSTKPRIRTWINAALTPWDIIEHHFEKSEKGFIAECQMQITEKVEGFEEGDSGYKSYQELRERNPNMRPRIRQFRTTGVVLCIEDKWFSKSGNKQFIADRFRELFCREYSVLPQDIGTASTNISLSTEEGNKPKSNCIVIFDQTYGSLRLSEYVYIDFSKLIDRLSVASKAEDDKEQEYYREAITHLREFYGSVEEPDVGESVSIEQGAEDGLVQVFSSGSRIALREQGVLFTDVEIIAPTILPDGQLWYQVKCPPKHKKSAPTKRWVSPDFIETTAQEGEWGYALWDPSTQEYVSEES
jgi:DEAD/DEAH box helicase domain-containing protein